LSLPVCCVTGFIALFLLRKKKKKKRVPAANVADADGITLGCGGLRYWTAVSAGSVADTWIVLRARRAPKRNTLVRRDMTRPQAAQSPLRVLVSTVDMLLGLVLYQPEQRQEPHLALALY